MKSRDIPCEITRLSMATGTQFKKYCFVGRKKKEGRKKRERRDE